LKSTELEHLDIAIIEINKETYSNHGRLTEIISKLNDLCTSESLITSFGIHLRLPPYMHHTPLKKQKNDMSAVPILLEDGMSSYKHFSLMLYNICASHNMPATYPMLEHPDGEVFEEEGNSYITMNVFYIEGINLMCIGIFKDDSPPRVFSRGAFDPLTCYRGFGTDGDDNDDEDVGSVTEDIKRLEEEAIEEEAKGSDGDSGIGYNPNILMVPGDKQQLEVDKQEMEEDVHQPLILISSVHPPQLEHSIAQALDDLCPELESSRRLEDKGIRIALSAGCEVVVVESNQCSKLGKLAFDKSLLLDSNETLDVFGSFTVPFSK
jgi:hypothetical protein